MTNHWIDIANSDCILVMGANPLKNHPISFKWVMKAVEKGATLISVDPRFTRTSGSSHIYAPLRAGTDLAFLGGMINYILENNLYFEEYVREYTNASFLVNPDFKLPGDNEGVFSGLTGTKTPEGYVDAKYDKTTWSFQLDANGFPKKNPTLKDPQCVFQLLKKHYSRYTLDMVTGITGTPKEDLLAVYKAFSATGKPDKSGTVMYAMGWTQHTVGTQNIRAMCIIQFLLGNMGMAGGGINALRGESNVQGACDLGLLYDILPGYLKTPLASLQTFEAYNAACTPKSVDPASANWLQNYPKYSASLLRELYGHKVPLEEAYTYLPKIDDGENYSWLAIFDRLYHDQFKGFLAWGQNPACSGADANKIRKGLTKLDWLVNVNLFDNETASFWKGPGMNPKEIKTEVFLLPCAASFEKEGSITNSGRWMQWRYRAVNPAGESLPDGDIISQLMGRLKKLYAKKEEKYPAPITKLRWEYGHKDADGNVAEVDTHAIAKEINGYYLEDKVINGKLYSKGTLVSSFADLQADGSTSCGSWIYCNSYTGAGNMAARRGKVDQSGIGLYSGWAWAWPLNRRIIYNRASVNIEGVPWAPQKQVLAWRNNVWQGDVPDGPWPPMKMAGGRSPFIMLPEGVGRIFGFGRNDGPFPEHYEPLESPLCENLLSRQYHNPIVKRWQIKNGENANGDFALSCDLQYPIVCTTYRVSEHWQTGVMTRWTPWLVELHPAMFVEISEELAALKEIKGGDKVVIKSARAQIEAIAVVTLRWKPITAGGRVIHQIGIPYHFGWVTSAERVYGKGDKKPELFTFGDSANLLTPMVGDANSMTPESKAFLVDIFKA